MRIADSSSYAPPRFVEYAYYAITAYGMLGDVWGLSVPLLSAGLLVVLAAFCLMRLGSRATVVYAPIVFPLGCAISFVALQVFLHGESLMGGDARPFVPWLLALIVVQSLSFRQGFLHRFSFAAFAIGLLLLPYLDPVSFTGVGSWNKRVGLAEGVGLGNPNSLAAWFGFLSVYFFILGLETKSTAVRTASWLVTVGCLYIVGITVSRGPLFGVAIATIIALRRLLKRGFFPVFVLLVLSWILYESGLFEEVAGFYVARGTEETGRLLVWPLAIEDFLRSPLAGAGVSNVETYVSEMGRLITPHNGFLFIAVASGVVPLAFFLGYWLRGAWGAFRANAERSADAPFLIPLFIFAFLETMILDFAFMYPGTIVVLSTVMAASAPRRVYRIMVRQTGLDKTAERSGGRDKPRYAIARYRLRSRPLRS